MKELKENPQVRFHPGGGCLRWPETPHLAPAAENCTMSCCCYPWIQGVTLLRHAERGEGTERWLSHTHTNTLKRTCKRVHRRSSFLPLHGRLPSHRQNHHGHESVMKAAAWQILSNGYTYTYETPTNGYATNTQNWPPRRILPIVHFLRLLMIIEAWLPVAWPRPELCLRPWHTTSQHTDWSTWPTTPSKMEVPPYCSPPPKLWCYGTTRSLRRGSCSTCLSVLHGYQRFQRVRQHDLQSLVKSH